MNKVKAKTKSPFTEECKAMGSVFLHILEK